MGIPSGETIERNKGRLRNIVLPGLTGLACLTVIAIGTLLTTTRYLHADLGNYLSIAGKIMHGGRYYDDFYETNLPLVFYIATVPLFIAHALMLPEIPVYQAFVTVISVLSMCLCAHILKGSRVYEDKPLYHLLIIGICIALFLPDYTLVRNAVGDKSFLLLAFVLPYFVSCVPRPKPMGASLTALTGFIAGAGFCLKPHFAVLWLGLECGMIIIHGKEYLKRLPLNMWMLAFALPYLTLLLMYFPEYWQLIFPIEKYFYVNSWAYSFALHVLTLIVYAIWYVPLLYAVTALPVSTEKARIRAVFLTGFIAICAESFAEGHMGFQRAQISAFTILLELALLPDFLRGRHSCGRWRFGAGILCFLTAFALYPAAQVYQAATTGRDPNITLLEHMLPYVERYAKDKSFLVFTPVPDLAFPLVNYAPARWNFRYYFIPTAVFRYYEQMDKSHFSAKEAADFERARAYFYDSLHRVMERDPPALIFALEKPAQAECLPPSRFRSELLRCWRFPEDFVKDPQFAREWQRYMRIGEIGGGGSKITIGIYIPHDTAESVK